MATMSIVQEIRDAVREARAASNTRPNDPFKAVLDQVAEGLSDESVEAGLTASPGGRWTLWLAPAFRPGKSTAMLDVIISATHAEVLLQRKLRAATPKRLAEILKKLVTTPEFLYSLAEIAELARQPVEGFLRVKTQSVSRDDLMVIISADQQRREIADRLGQETSLTLQIADVSGAGTFKPDAPYKVLEAAGFAIWLSRPPRLVSNELHVTGRVELTVEV